ncbi:MAG: nitrous oxide reductase family maturation protein NosD, partial [Cypionkella sp.]|nr:nitrous oxide reductase family maturation protein NosD [Cypionkella sp.]
MRLSLSLILILLALPALADEVHVAPGAGALQTAIAGAKSGDALLLSAGIYPGPFVIDRPMTIAGEPGAILD